MKTKNYFMIVAALVLLINQTTKAQSVVIPFTNILSCDVTVGYEEWYTPTAGTCSTSCQWGSFTIPPNSTVNHTTCSPFIDICVWVIDIGGVAVNAGGCYNHCSTNFCCQIPPTGQTGTCGNSSCFPVTGWQLSYNIASGVGGSWLIQ